MTLLVCMFSGVSVRHEPETQGYLALGLFYEALKLYAQFPIRQRCNLCHSGIMLDYLSRPKAVVQRRSILCGAHSGLVAAEHKSVVQRRSRLCGAHSGLVAAEHKSVVQR